MKKHAPNDNKLAIAYYRYSSASQNEASIEQQQRLARQWAQSQGLTLVEEYKDLAKTGRNMERPGLQKMLAEVPTIRPAYLVTWKVDRLGRDRRDLMEIRHRLMAAGVRIHYIEGIDPSEAAESVLMESVFDGFAEFYSLNLSANIRRGVHFNAENARANGHKIFGYLIGADKKYVEDPQTAPFVRQMFSDYARGVSMKTISDQLNSQGVRTVRGYEFTPKALNKLLKARCYIGEYSYAGHVIPGGMPALVDEALFEEVQRRFSVNKRLGARTKAQLAAMGDDAPDYWLTGHLWCERCGAPMEGVSGTSKTGRKHRYYYCLNQRKKRCTAKPVRKDDLEARVVQIVEGFLEDTEMLASLAVDMADHYRATHGRREAALEALEAQRRDVEKKLANFIKAIGMGIFNEDTQAAMEALRAQKDELETAIQTKRVKAVLAEDESSIGAFYARFAKATMDTVETREQLLGYFVDKIFVSAETLSIASWFYEHGTEITHDNLVQAKETGDVLTLSREFDTSPSGGDGGN